MRRFVIDRHKLVVPAASLPEAVDVNLPLLRERLDALGFSDGMPFATEDDGTVGACASLNAYIQDAVACGAYSMDGLARNRMPALFNLLAWLRRRDAEHRASAEGVPVLDWLSVHGEPRIDLLEASRRDLIAYRDLRLQQVARSTVNTQMSYISAFFAHAHRETWIGRNPVPQWGPRNTLLVPGRVESRARFLTAAQTRAFLQVGLRGDGHTTDRPDAPERDHLYGLALATTGLRRAEGAFLLDCEVPPPEHFSHDGVSTFPRVGKKGVTRNVYLTQPLAAAADFYRRTERHATILAAQPGLRRRLRAGELLVLDGVTTLRGKPAVIRNGRTIPATALNDSERQRAVTRTDSGLIEPAVLLVGRRGLPPTVNHWNAIFAAARLRADELDAGLRPPQHIRVTPHTLRHTYAVRTLAGLMEQGQQRAGDPYALLANPVLTVKELLGHADVSTTHHYLHAAETWGEHVPAVLARTVSDLTAPEGTR